MNVGDRAGEHTLEIRQVFGDEEEMLRHHDYRREISNFSRSQLTPDQGDVLTKQRRLAVKHCVNILRQTKET